MCGGFTHSSGHLGSRQAVLRRGDAVRQRLTRHLLSLCVCVWSSTSTIKRPIWSLTPDHTHTHTHAHARTEMNQ